MEALTVELTYGQALFDAAEDLGKSREIGEEYKAISGVFADHPSLKKLFLVPTLSAHEKKAVAKTVFEGRISQELLNFLYILIDKGRIGVWDRIGRQYEKLVLERDGLIRGIVYTVLPVDSVRLKALEEKTGAALDRNVKLENRIDKSIIGGAVIYIDGKLIDASVKARIENMKQRMKQ